MLKIEREHEKLGAAIQNNNDKNTGVCNRNRVYSANEIYRSNFVKAR